MKRVYLIWILSALVGFVSIGLAQEKPKTEPNEKKMDARRELIPLRVQVVFSEYDAEKKISSLPYILHINTNSRASSIRMGLRVPVQTQSTGPVQFQYVDMGTNIDGSADRTDDGRFAVRLTVERSSAYSGSEQKLTYMGGSEIGRQPVIQQFKANVDLLLRDGQTTQSTLSTDPVTGRVLKIDVSLNIAK